MRAIVTSDWQAAWPNLDRCKVIEKQILQVCKDEDIKLVIHCGDLKHYYSPVDVRVFNFGARFVQRCVERGIEVVILLGNHDRASMSHDATDWLPALAAAGAYTISKPQAIETKQGTIVGIPYSQQHSVTRKAIKRLAAKHKGSVMLFHHELRGCQLNTSEMSKEAELRVKDLQPKSWSVCLGGHIHLHQKLSGNVYYVGSPFAQDWGEANQQKGLILLDGSKVKFIPSPVPGLYDPTLPGFHETKPHSWDGTKVRVHVVVDKSAAAVYKDVIDKATNKAKAKYPGADITVSPEFLDVDSPTTLRSNGSDEDIVRLYVKKTCPPSISDKKALVRYLADRLEEFGALKKDSQRVELISAEGHNFLPFEDVKLKFTPGITVVTGLNKDWQGRNNGSGKTSLLQLPAVAWFGWTLKEQTADSWVRDNIGKEKAWVKFKFRLADKRRCSIYRQRNPPKLTFHVEGIDESIGIGTKGTQAALERYTGMSWESMQNAMYIDQTEVSTILTGTDGQRKAIFAKFLNLERFTKARDACAEKVKLISSELSEVLMQAAHCRRSIDSTKEMLEDLPDPDISGLKAKRIKLKARWEKVAAKLKAIAAREDAERKRCAKLNNQRAAELFELQKSLADAYANSGYLSTKIRKLQTLVAHSGKCPECGQSVTKQYSKDAIKRAEKFMRRYDAEADRCKAAITDLGPQVYPKLTSEEVTDALWAKQRNIEHALGRIAEKFKQAKKTKRLHSKYQNKLARLERVLEDKYVKRAGELGELIDYEKYCIKAFSKDGIPAYVAARLCPALNAASKHYSKLYSEDELQVRFDLVDKDIDVSIVNLHGGATLKKQSAGETRIAGLITSFAIRDVINPSNVLILDEPSESLDAANAKVFAEGLRQASKGLGSVILTTHNPYVLGELEGERLIQVTKHNKVSTARVRYQGEARCA